MIVSQLVKTLPSYNRTRRFLPCSQDPSTAKHGPTEPAETNSHLDNMFPMLILHSHVHLSLQNNLSPIGVSTKSFIVHYLRILRAPPISFSLAWTVTLRTLIKTEMQNHRLIFIRYRQFYEQSKDKSCILRELRFSYRWSWYCSFKLWRRME
jgi:hypothetical protein